MHAPNLYGYFFLIVSVCDAHGSTFLMEPVPWVYIGHTNTAVCGCETYPDLG